MLFEKQYILTEEVIVETRYRTETDTWTDADGNTHTETYRVPYDYYICNVKLENFNSFVGRVDTGDKPTESISYFRQIGADVKSYAI